MHYQQTIFCIHFFKEKKLAQAKRLILAELVIFISIILTNNSILICKRVFYLRLFKLFTNKA